MYKQIIFILLLLILTACNKRVSDALTEIPTVDLPSVGTENTLEIATWNIERFPLRNDITIDKTADIMLDWDIDVYAVQEIINENQLEILIDSLNSKKPSAQYDYLLNPDISGDIATGFIYKSSLLTVKSTQTLFVGDNDFAGRPAFILEAELQKNGKVFDVNLMVLHLKAFGDAESEGRRRNAIVKLQNYIEQQLQVSTTDPDFIVLGDWNDVLTDATSRNVFTPFLNNTNLYEFLTLPLAQDPSEITFIDGFNSLIDHIMITSSIRAQFPTIETRILRPDESVFQYISDVSDHRPVVSILPVFQ